MNYKIILLSALIIAFTQCSNYSNRNIVSQYNLISSTLSLDTEILAPRDITILHDSIMIVRSLQEDSYYHIFRLNNSSLSFIRSFGIHGKGATELISPNKIQTIGDSIGIYDINTRRFNYYMLSSNTINGSLNSIKYSYLDISQSKLDLNVIEMYDHSLFGASISGDRRYGLLRDNVDIILDIPFPEDNIECSLLQKSMVYQGLLVAHPKKLLIAYASNVGDIFEIYDLTDKHKISTISVISTIPDYKSHTTSEISANYGDELTNGYNKLCATDEYIYALYNGNLSKERKYDCSILRVYDWSGTHIANMTLDRGITFFSVDMNNRLIYGITDELSHCEVVRFELPEFN